MSYNKIFEEFLEEIQNESYASADEVRKVTYDMLQIIQNNKDATPEELVEKIIVDNVKLLEDIKNSYPIPGYTVGVTVNNINVKLFGGDIDSMQRKMPDDALFDIASMTKFYTQIVAYNLIKEKVFSLSDKISDLDPKFENLNDLTVRDILTFTTNIATNGRVEDANTVTEALDRLYQSSVVSKGEYQYTDIGLMIMKEVMENTTGISYADLVDQYIIKPLNLKDTHLIVPKQKIDLVTGTPNAKMGKVNDPKALALGGYSGHAGIFASSDDLIKLAKGATEGIILPEEGLKDAYTPGVKPIRGVMGNTYTSHEKGIDASYVDKLEPITNFAIQGSTRVQMNISKTWKGASTILFNPASMSLEQALEEEAKINEKRALNNQASLSLVKHFKFNQNGDAIEYDLINPVQMAPGGKTVEPVTTENAKLALRLRFLSKVIDAYDKNYTKEITVSKNIK